MLSATESLDITCAIFVDMGTTNTRVWLTYGDEIIAQAQGAIGARDTARHGSSAPLREALRDLLSRVQADALRSSRLCAPTCVVASGMITSSLGLLEVPHITAPAGRADLAAAAQRHHFADITNLPVLLIPGVRIGPVHCDSENVREIDLIRGEETLCVGLHGLGWLGAAGTVLNLGSHWKAIRLDAQGRIASSITSLSGELIHAAQTQTILASAVPHERPARLADPWIEAGMREQRRSGLARALFCVRLLEQRSRTTPEERLAYLAGAFIAADLDPLLASGHLSGGSPLLITGDGALAGAWKLALARVSISATTVPPHEAERAWLAGLRYIVAARGSGI